MRSYLGVFQQIDFRELAEKGGPELAYVSLYASGPGSLDSLKKRADRIRALLARDEAELEHFEESLRMIREALDGYTFQREGVAVFACWAEDFLVGYPLTVPVPDLLRVDEAPYIRPLAELRDEYENFVVVAADAERARIFLVTSAIVAAEKRVRGDVKQRVKKGGWSQKRFERRREKELTSYAKEVASVVADLEGRVAFERIALLGSEQAMREIREALPPRLSEKVVGQRAVSLEDRDDVPMEPALQLVFEREREEEAELWERIRGEYLRGGLAAVGSADVLEAVREGRAEMLLLDRAVELPGVRCRDCESVQAGSPDACPTCGRTSLFPVEVGEVLVELATLSSALVEFVDAHPELDEVGSVAALLRY